MSSRKVQVTLKVEIPGGPHARYTVAGRSGQPRLAAVVYPPERLPGDLCQATQTLGGGERPLAALLLGPVSHPAGCEVAGRLLGLMEVTGREERRQILVAVAVDDAHFDGVTNVDELSELRRRQVALAFQLDGGGPDLSVCWQEAATAEALLAQARQAYRLALAEGRELQALGPAWKPLSGTESEAAPHTAAEYSFHRLPYRFQKYVSAYLADDERILFALQRPAMRSALQGGLWRGRRLEEAVFIISTQQIAEVAELMPPDRAGIRYGFVARCGLLERLESVALRSLSRDVLGLQISWRGSGGREQVTWEFPAGGRVALEEALALLEGWLPRVDDRRVQRATPPEAPQEPEPLVDPGANDPAETKALAARLEPELARALLPEEPVLARCLLPAWIKQRGAPSLLAVTPERLLVVTEPGAAEQLRLALPLHAISSFEFSSTLIRAYLKVMVPSGDGTEEVVIHFGSTLGAMDGCYLALRRATGVVPAVDLNTWKQPQKE